MQKCHTSRFWVKLSAFEERIWTTIWTACPVLKTKFIEKVKTNFWRPTLSPSIYPCLLPTHMQGTPPMSVFNKHKGQKICHLKMLSSNSVVNNISTGIKTNLPVLPNGMEIKYNKSWSWKICWYQNNGAQYRFSLVRSYECKRWMHRSW